MWAGTPLMERFLKCQLRACVIAKFKLTANKITEFSNFRKMSLEESRKRKSPESELPEENIEEMVEENVNSKHIKIDQEQINNSNLETEQSQDSNSENKMKTDESKNGLAKDIKNVQNRSGETPFSISIKFRDESVADMYRSRFLKFINTFIELETKFDDKLTINVFKDDSLNPKDWEVIDETLALDTTITEQETSLEDSPTSKKKRNKKRSKAKKELFVVDANPSSDIEPADLRYTSKFVINTEKTEEIREQSSNRQTCFNCDQNHSLKDCPEPKDFARINAARQKFRQQPKASRYHLEEEQKYSHLKPGKISSELRKALGLPKNEIPHYVYLMRRMGYPPGWLEEAKILHSELDMFDIDGKNVKSGSSKKSGLDPDRVIDYPGFNVPFEKGISDDFRAYGVPPFSNDFSKDAMVEFFNKQCAKQEDNLETCDMDVDPDESPVEKPSIKIDHVQDNPRDSPSLIDLEQEKQKLLKELDDEPAKVDEPTKVEEPDRDKEKADELSVKASSFGTPILKSRSPYVRLPNPDNFSKDVSPVINFENLPNSTGKYEQMTDVLQKVRDTMKKLQNCNT